MRLTAALFAAGLTLAAAQARAEGGPRPEEIAAFLAAVTAAGCVVNDSNEAKVVAAAHLTMDQASGVVQRLQDEGRMIAGPGQELRLKEGCK